MTEKKCILVVEDEWLLAADMASRLEDLGYDVLGPVPSVGQAKAKLDDTRPDAAILDVQLIGETTLGLAACLEEQSIPFFFLSGHSASDFSDLKGRRILTKPADWIMLQDALKQVLAET